MENPIAFRHGIPCNANFRVNGPAGKSTLSSSVPITNQISQSERVHDKKQAVSIMEKRQYAGKQTCLGGQTTLVKCFGKRSKKS